MTIYKGTDLIAEIFRPVEPTRNIGQIITSIIPLQDAGLHLLDGSLINGNGIYSAFVDYIADLYTNSTNKLSRYTERGTIVENAGVISGFSLSNYIIFGYPFIPNSNTWEIGFKFTTGSAVADQVIYESNRGLATGSLYSPIRLAIDNNSKFYFCISPNLTSETATTCSTTAIPNTTYYTKLVFNGSTYKLYISTDGTTYTEDGSFTYSTHVYQGLNFIGGRHSNQEYPYPFTGSIDLDGCYIDIAGERQWAGRMPSGFITYEGWKSSVDNMGTCGFFVYNSVNNTVRLPKVTGFIEGTEDIKKVGALIGAGLPNITGSISDFNAGLNSTPAGAFSDSSFPTTLNQIGTGYGLNWGNLRFDASRSNPIYGNSSTVQPQAIRVLYYIVIATTAKTEIEVDIDEVATDLNGKADIDLDNISSTGKAMMANASMPSSKYIDITVGSSGSSYTAPADGWVGAFTQNSSYCNLHNITCVGINSTDFKGNAGEDRYATIPVAKGDNFTFYYDGTVQYFRFLYAKGE